MKSIPPFENTSDLKSLSVLVVDDQETNRKLLRAVLEAEGVLVREASDGVEALEALGQQSVDVVVTDILMPRLDGYSLCREMRSNPRWRGISIIVYTAAHVSSGDEKRALEMGADTFLRKPSSPGAIREALRRVNTWGDPRQERAAVASSAGRNTGGLKEYNEQLVSDLKRRSAELAAANQQLRETEERFHQITESIEEVFWMTPPDLSQILYVSPAYERIWGRKCEDLYSNPLAWTESIVPEDRERVVLAARSHAQDGYSQEYRIQRPDGELRWVQDRGYHVRDTEGKITRIVGVATDVTKQKALEAQYFRAQRMECLGRLAGGIAHDLNNILAPVLMGIPLLRLGLKETNVERTFTMIEKSAQRGAEMVKQLLLFGRGADGKCAPMRIKDAVYDATGILETTLPKNISVGVKLSADLCLISGDSTQIQQILLNLCVNARDAMPSGGELTISAANVRLDVRTAQSVAGGKPGDYVVLRVADTGTGIPTEIVDRIFDPFFTTKEVGKGTGLGLATVHDIATSHGGFVSVDSQVGRGTTFSIYLPSLETGGIPEPASEIPLPPPAHQQEVLIVDDEEAILNLLREILQNYGYSVITAADGIEGAAMYLKHKASISLVITDLSMPRLGGTALVQIIRTLDPALPIIVSSGSESGEDWPELMAEIRRLGVSAVVPKPFNVASILNTLHSALMPKAA